MNKHLYPCNSCNMSRNNASVRFWMVARFPWQFQISPLEAPKLRNCRKVNSPHIQPKTTFLVKLWTYMYFNNCPWVVWYSMQLWFCNFINWGKVASRTIMSKEALFSWINRQKDAWEIGNETSDTVSCKVICNGLCRCLQNNVLSSSLQDNVWSSKFAQSLENLIIMIIEKTTSHWWVPMEQ